MKKECKNCFNKGYNTEFVGDTIAHHDFISDPPTHSIRSRGVRINLCDCQRGKDLDKYFKIKKECQRRL